MSETGVINKQNQCTICKDCLYKGQAKEFEDYYFIEYDNLATEYYYYCPECSSENIEYLPWELE